MSSSGRMVKSGNRFLFLRIPSNEIVPLGKSLDPNRPDEATMIRMARPVQA